ncbi:DUF1049 domain-containing protein [Chryseobacterium taklimakanense]|uniref:DUF1049 domain-containing protein n=1 Tax=Chryseobacterium taklimakanense TaxID=536441 RepID=A0A3G8WG22_9FLAO|nr:DUF1049 domain-containing protein [Chryseobacterium taklimakanense]AZI19499.1 DUF1049 domain-containing protein [Chryseobacterium taklimakanense]MCG7279974.1 DUF1049 domain-containing protein [Chryseobacterium taklimakanense]
MKSVTFIGIVMLILAALLFYLTTDFAVEQIKLSHIMGIMAGVGLGLILGSMVGYVSKGSAIKAEQKRKEFKQLQKEKAELEKQAAELAKQQEAASSVQNQNNNTQNY